MCRIGDIIVIENCKIGNKNLGRHSFVVLNTNKGEIEGLSFDLVCNLMSSFEGKGEEYKKKKLTFPENMPYSPTEENVINGHGKDGFIKAGLYFLFNREEIEYNVIGNVEPALYLRLLRFIEGMEPELIKYVIDNLVQSKEATE